MYKFNEKTLISSKGYGKKIHSWHLFSVININLVHYLAEAINTVKSLASYNACLSSHFSFSPKSRDFGSGFFNLEK